MSGEKSIPYQDLYVYEISGEISDSKNIFKEDFIGCWNEGEISCLFFSLPMTRRLMRLLERDGLAFFQETSWIIGPGRPVTN